MLPADPTDVWCCFGYSDFMGRYSVPTHRARYLVALASYFSTQVLLCIAHECCASSKVMVEENVDWRNNERMKNARRTL